jgi:nucleoside-diphosphate-sugar epimerase
VELVAIVGATGPVGRSIAAALRGAGRPYVAIARDRAALERDFGSDSGAQLRTWDTGDSASVRAAFAGVDAAVYCVGVDYTQFDLHPKLMRATLAGLEAAGVRRLLLIGTVYPYGLPQSAPVREDHPRNPNSFKGKMRKEQEELVLDAHARGEIQGAVLRLPDFYGPGVSKSFASSIFDAAAKGGTAQMIGPIDKPHEYVFIPDVGPIVVRLLDDPRAFGRVWHYAGPAFITPREFAAKVFAHAGRSVRISAVPLWMLKFLGTFNPMMKEVAEMQYLFSDPVLMDDRALGELLGDLPKTTYDDGIAFTLRETARFVQDA